MTTSLNSAEREQVDASLAAGKGQLHYAHEALERLATSIGWAQRYCPTASTERRRVRAAGVAYRRMLRSLWANSSPL